MSHRAAASHFPRDPSPPTSIKPPIQENPLDLSPPTEASPRSNPPLPPCPFWIEPETTSAALVSLDLVSLSNTMARSGLGGPRAPRPPPRAPDPRAASSASFPKPLAPSSPLRRRAPRAAEHLVAAAQTTAGDQQVMSPCPASSSSRSASSRHLLSTSLAQLSLSFSILFFFR